MNSPHDPRLKQPGLEGRVTRLEVTCERILEELKEIRVDMREMRRDINLARTVDFRLLFGALIASDVAIIGILANGFGWI